ncbi:MAG TPA: tetratricopeptide repeat protein [Anaerolineae bacterium]|nr:tetratricopeptide repeat protein [Anaerolineae bacterium]HQM13044.1 tetratricopeptide repeat protein [Anaerolineae bacterium]
MNTVSSTEEQAAAAASQRCLRCGHLNPPGARYCNSCGALLRLPEEDLLPAASVGNAEEALQRLQRFLPRVVANSLLHTPEGLRSERREITVLFVDAVDFTHLSASLDAESVFKLINDFLGLMVASVHHYDGLVDKFTGDGLMAVFGAPVAHENDAELAVRTALDMQRAIAEFAPIAQTRLGAPIQIRIGINCGLAVAGVLGTETQAAYTVIGETVNLAARLESHALPGHILVSERVYQQTQALFNYQALGEMTIRGLDTPLPLYDLLSERAIPLAVRGLAGVRPVFLGHAAELEQLAKVRTALLEQHTGGIVIIRGEAGIGKTRLVAEWLSALSPNQANVFQGRGLPYAQGTGYGIFRSLLQNALRALPGGLAEVERYVSPDLRPHLRAILGVRTAATEHSALRELEPEQIKKLTLLAMREWAVTLSAECPLILILEDFHWADDLSHDMLNALVSLTRELPVLLCVITRPQPEKPLSWAAAGEAATGLLVTEINVSPLSNEDSRALLENLINVRELPEAMIQLLLRHAEGNPFYIEEFVRTLIERQLVHAANGQWEVSPLINTETLEIPTTLRGLMMARVDRLPEDLRNLLRDAAVIGLQFSASLLNEVRRRQQGSANVLPALERLTEMGLLVERHEGEEKVYAFRHILTQETIYSSLLRSQRPLLHRNIAEAIEQLYAADLAPHVEVLALHYDRAGERSKALKYLLLAGDRARQRFANREALDYYSRALQLAQHIETYAVERRQANIGLGDINQHVGNYEEAIACYRAALESPTEGFQEDAAEVMLKLGQVWHKKGNQQEAEIWLRQGLAQLRLAPHPLPKVEAQLDSELGWLSLRQGDVTTAQRWLEQAAQLAGQHQLYGPLSAIFNRLGAVYYAQGDLEKATAAVQKSLELLEQVGDVVGMARPLNNLGILQKNQGDWEKALSSYHRCLEIVERIGDIEGTTIAYTNLGVLYTDLGQWDEAERHLLWDLKLAQQLANPYHLAQAHRNLGRVYLLRKQWNKSAQHLNAAISLYRETGARGQLELVNTQFLRGWLGLEQGYLEVAREAAQTSYDLLQAFTRDEAEIAVEKGRCEMLLARLAQARGDTQNARTHIEESLRLFHKSGAIVDEAHSRYWSARFYLDCESTQQAHDELLRARQIFAHLGAAADLQETEAALAQLEHETAR